LTVEAISITELHRHLGHYLDIVQQGGSFVITRYGKPVALLQPHQAPR